jgi:hypothetical protein
MPMMQQPQATAAALDAFVRISPRLGRRAQTLAAAGN